MTIPRAIAAVALAVVLQAPTHHPNPSATQGQELEGNSALFAGNSRPSVRNSACAATGDSLLAGNSRPWVGNSAGDRSFRA